MAKSKFDVVLVIERKREGEYGHITGRVAKAAPMDRSGWKHFEYLECPLEHVRITSQCDQRADCAGMYGYEVEWAANSTIRLHEMREAIKVLAPIQKRMHDMYTAEGSHKSFGQWINRVARAIGAKAVFIRQSQQWADRHGQPWRHHDLGDAVSAVDREVETLLTELNPERRQKEAA